VEWTAENFYGDALMKFTEGRVGRVFVIRLEHGDRLPDCIDNFAAERGVTHGNVIIIGGVEGGEIVVGPRKGDARPVDPMLAPVDGAHEIAGVGVIAPGPDGKPRLHVHAALGRSGQTKTGCLRPGVFT
jgi:predicted DNA-binding protein with PD1-like motif